MLFSLRLDEAGTDGLMPYVVLAGAVAPVAQWKKLDTQWLSLLDRKRIKSYHWQDFNQRTAGFSGWRKLKLDNLQRAQNKIIRANTLFPVSVGIDSSAHKDVKDKMKGIKGFRPDSDYSLCLRYLMFIVSEELKKLDPDFRLSVMVEDGPFSSGATQNYQNVAAMTAKWKPAKHAHHLAGFVALPKGETPSLEAADYLAGVAAKRMAREERASGWLSMVLRKAELETWYTGMIEEKERRRTYHSHARVLNAAE